MTVEENKAIVRRHLIDVLEQGHVELIDGYYAPDGSVAGMTRHSNTESASCGTKKSRPIRRPISRSSLSANHAAGRS